MKVITVLLYRKSNYSKMLKNVNVFLIEENRIISGIVNTITETD
jgi:hypothetical protein